MTKSGQNAQAASKQLASLQGLVYFQITKLMVAVERKSEEKRGDEGGPFLL